MRKYTGELIFDGNSVYSLILSEIKDGSTVLEFGCASGRVSKCLKEKGCSVYGLEIMQDALEDAKQYLTDSLCCDVEKLEWVEKFAGLKFDAILFSDVLEHLRAPYAVLDAAEKLLKEDGFIIASIPNIAHADVISNLYLNRFDYTREGLLDETHIHFWGYHNLVEGFAEGSLFLTWVKGSYAYPRKTEQKTDKSNDSVFAELYKKKYADVYQFVFKLYKRSYAVSNRLIYTNYIKESAFSYSQIYYNYGGGYSEEESNRVEITDKSVSLTVPLRSDIKTLRVDPIDGYYCYVGGICAKCGDKTIPILKHNGKRLGNSILFATEDSHFELDLSAYGGQELTLTYKVLDLTANQVDILDETYANDMALYASEKATEATSVLVREINELNEKHAAEIASSSDRINMLSNQLNQCNADYAAAMNAKNFYETSYSIIKNSAFWKITAPARKLLDGIKALGRLIKAGLKKIPPIRALAKFLRCWRENGFKYTMRKIKNKLRNRQDYSAVNKPLYTESELEAQRKFKFSRDIKFSILVPLYNTPERFLREMIQSVLDQTYRNFELCLADGSDDKHKDVGAICKGYAQKDSRIVYKKLERNMGISINTNACIDMASGDYIGLFDHDDLLHPALLYNIMEAICQKDADFIYTDENTFSKEPKDAYCPNFKPDYAPDTLRSYNYICHFSCFSRELLERAGKYFRPECDGSQDYDMILRLTDAAKSIVHIPKILYYWRAHAASVASDISAKPYVIEAAHKALSDHLVRVGLHGEVTNSSIPSTYKINYEIDGEPLVSIVIANKDHTDDLDKCICSIIEKTTYKNYEIIVVENNSTESETFAYYDKIKAKYDVKVTTWEGGGKFNYSAINNHGVGESRGEYVVLLNNDTEIITPEWIEEMLMFAQRPDVGAVGVKLYFPDDTIQHAGVILGIGGVGGHAHKYFPRDSYGYMSRAQIAQNLTAVTAACVMVPRRVWNEIEGLDEAFEVAFNDVDMCMRIRKAGYLIVFTPYCELYHYESKSRGPENDPVKRKRFQGEVLRFMNRWQAELDAGDPYYNPNLTLEHEDFSLR